MHQPEDRTRCCDLPKMSLNNIFVIHYPEKVELRVLNQKYSVIKQIKKAASKLMKTKSPPARFGAELYG
jgi:hypothetical protein